jgi:hypothetical protein
MHLLNISLGGISPSVACGASSLEEGAQSASLFEGGGAKRRRESAGGRAPEGERRRESAVFKHCLS